MVGQHLAEGMITCSTTAYVDKGAVPGCEQAAVAESKMQPSEKRVQRVCVCIYIYTHKYKYIYI